MVNDPQHDVSKCWEAEECQCECKSCRRFMCAANRHRPRKTTVECYTRDGHMFLASLEAEHDAELDPEEVGAMFAESAAKEAVHMTQPSGEVIIVPRDNISHIRVRLDELPN